MYTFGYVHRTSLFILITVNEKQTIYSSNPNSIPKTQTPSFKGRALSSMRIISSYLCRLWRLFTVPDAEFASSIHSTRQKMSGSPTAEAVHRTGGEEKCPLA